MKNNILNIITHSIAFIVSILMSSFAFGQYQSLSVNANGIFYEVQYVIHKKQKKDARKVLRRDFVTFHLETRTEKDSVLKSTFKTQEPIVKEISIEEYKYSDKGFMEDMLLKLQVGDSATFLVDSESLFEAIKRPRPAFIQQGSKVKYIVKVLKAQNDVEVNADEQGVLFKKKKVDEKIIAEYVAKNMQGAKKTYSGIWYNIHQQGEGDFAVIDDVVAIEYTGKFLDGKVFNSSERDGRLLEFPVGAGFVIKGLDEVMLLMKKGAKATFVIPSYLAYSEEGLGDKIPSNSPLIFEIQFIDIVVHKIIIEKKGDVTSDPKKDKNKETNTTPHQPVDWEKDLKKKGGGITGQ
jgi:FKBP-type peptidyl-prolyl cis-trans isomerase FkpA